MPRYYFDVRDGGHFTEDSEGLELAGLKEARDEAARALADLADDVLPDGTERDRAIEVRDADRAPLFVASLHFEVRPARQVS